MGIADKLRNYAKHWAEHEIDRILALEAANEIERLRSENAEYEAGVKVARQIFCS